MTTLRRDSAGYSYLNGVRLGLATVKALEAQSGGADSATIDAGFADPNLRNKLVWREKLTDGVPVGRWEPEYDNWYQKLDITPEYLIEKCEANGRNSPELKDMLRGPLASRLYDARPKVKPTRDQALHEKAYLPDLEESVRDQVEKYDADVVREGEREAYQKCKLRVPESKIDDLRRVSCHEFMCRDPEGPTGPKRRAGNLEELAEVMRSPLPDSEKDKYRYCAGQHNIFCGQPPYMQVPKKGPFKHIQNSGLGDCLFIAVAQYIKFANALGKFPNFEDNDIPTDDYKLLRPWLNTSVCAFEAGNILRTRAVNWLKAHPHVSVPSESIPVNIMAAGTLLNTKDMGNIMHATSNLGRKIDDLYMEFTKKHAKSAAALGLKGRYSEAQLLKAYNTIADRDIIVVEDPSKEEHIGKLVDFFSSYYFKNMQDPNTYAGQLEVFALSQVMRVNIHVWVVDGTNYGRLAYMSFNATPQSESTINIIKTGAVQHATHYEILFPWQTSVLLQKAISTHAEFKTAYGKYIASRTREFTLDPQAVPAREADMMLQTLMDLSLSKIGLYDKLVSGEQASGTEDKYIQGSYLRKFIFDLLEMHQDKINVPVIINCIHRLIIRNIPTTTGSDKNSKLLAFGQGNAADKSLRIAVTAFIVKTFGLKKLGSIGHSFYNQLLADLIVALDIPHVTLSTSSYNIETLIRYLSKQNIMMDDPRVHRFRDAFIEKVNARFTSDMYYFHSFRKYFGPNMFETGNLIDLIYEMKRIEEYINFNVAKITLSEEAIGKGYVYIDGAVHIPETDGDIDMGTNEVDEMDEAEVLSELKELWPDLPDEDIDDILKAHLRLKEAGSDTTLIDIVAEGITGVSEINDMIDLILS